jgi:hypothetical protein
MGRFSRVERGEMPMVRRSLIFALAAAAVFTATASAHADPALPSGSDAPLTPLAPNGAERQWYGWQTLLIDGVSLGSMPLEVGSSSFASTPTASYLFVGSMSGYLLGPPLVHALHGSWARAATDLALRAGAVALGGLVGSAMPELAPSCDPVRASCLTVNTNGGVVVFALAGAMIASTIDASFLGWEAHPREASRGPSLMVVPTAEVTPTGGGLGIGGTF